MPDGSQARTDIAQTGSTVANARTLPTSLGAPATEWVAIASWNEEKDGKADWGEGVKAITLCVEPELNMCNLDFDAESGRRYRWSVTAIDSAKIDIARSEPRTIETTSSILAAIKKSGLSL